MAEQATAPSNSERIDVDGCAALYVELRDKITIMKNELKEKLKPYNKGLEDLDAVLLKALQDQGAKSITTPSGTVYQRIERSATVKDRKAFSEFVKGNLAWDLIDWRANKVAVFSYMEDKAVEVPGVNTSAYMAIGVRRGTGNANDDQQED